MLISWLLYTFIIVTTIQISYHIFFSSILFHKDYLENIADNMPVSVIICAKNEEKNLKKNLDSVCNQNYNDFEIVLINDASSDATLEVMKEYQERFSNIKIVNVAPNERFWGNKKYALTLGIKASKYEHLLFTDADCAIASEFWISRMSTYFSAEKTIVLGYGKYGTKNNSLLSLLITFETLLTAIQYFSYAKFGNPYMAVGRNLAYKKSEFFKTKGFIKHIQINSGDDDLFIQQAANKKNTAICLAPDSFTISDAPASFKAWFHQKRRHISTAKLYKLKHKLLLGLFYFSKVIFYCVALVLLFSGFWKIVLLLLFSYFLIFQISLSLLAKKFQENKIIWYLPFLEICLMCFQFTIFIANKVSKPALWK